MLAAAAESGALQLFVLLYEVQHLAGDREFVAAELLAWSELPANKRLREALESVIGAEFGAGKLGKLFARWDGVGLGGIAISAIGKDENAVLWRCHPKTRCPEAEITDNVALLPTIRRRTAT